MAISKKDRELLSLYQRSGSDLSLEETPQNRQSPSASSRITKRKHKRIASQQPVKSESYTERSASRIMADNSDNFQELCEAIKKFDGCEIKEAAINTVIYDGQVDAKIMVVGEAPGANEDEQGIPFCGQSGKLLDNIFPFPKSAPTVVSASVVEGAVLLVVMLALVGIVEAVAEDKVLVVVVLIVGGTVVGAVVVAVVVVVGLVIVVGEVVVAVVELIGRLSNTETVPEPALIVAISGVSSPLKSEVAAAIGCLPTL